VPFKSQAQKLKIAQLEKEGKVKKGTFEEWNKATPPGRLPKRIGPMKAPKGGRR